MDSALQEAPFEEVQLSGWKYFDQLGSLLSRLRSHQTHPNRLLHCDHYVSLLLLYFFNPIVTSLRGIQFASTLQKVQSKLGVRRASLGSLSEASQVFKPEILAGLFKHLASFVQADDAVLRPQDIPQGLRVVIQDGTLLNALPRMLWALWRDGQRGVKAHVQFDLFKSVPVNLELTTAQGSEKDALKRMLVPGLLYLIDRGFHSYALFQNILEAGSSFICRVQDNTVYEILEEHPLSTEAQQAGVLLDVKANLGTHLNRGALTQPLRLLKIRVQADPAQRFYTRRRTRESDLNHRVQEAGGVIVVLTDRFDLSAELIALLYR